MLGVNRDSSEGSDVKYWMKLMNFRQNRVEEKLEIFQRGMDTLTTTIQGTESMYKTLQGDVEDLKSNSHEVWQRLMSDEQRLSKLESSIDKMARAGLDYKNPVGAEAYKVFKNLCIIERNKSEGSRESERIASARSRSPRSSKSPKPKPKYAHKIGEVSGNKSEEETSNGAFATKFSTCKWYRADLKFPCPMTNHQHEMSTSAEFFSMSPRDRWNKMKKGRICYACLAPKAMCVNRRCSFKAKVSESLKCQGCATWAQSKYLAPLSVLFCKRKECAELQAHSLR